SRPTVDSNGSRRTTSMRINARALLGLLAILSLLATACGGDDGDAADAPTAEEAGAEDASTDGGGDGALSGTIRIDGSSTVGPLTDAIAEEYAAEQPDVLVELGISGTGGGFERFCGEGSTEIS